MLVLKSMRHVEALRLHTFLVGLLAGDGYLITKCPDYRKVAQGCFQNFTLHSGVCKMPVRPLDGDKYSMTSIDDFFRKA